MMKFDIVIVGGGLVGASAAVSMNMLGFKVALIESADMAPASTNEAEWDTRIYAITPGNVSWLRHLGVWQKLDKSRICPIRKMQVWGDEPSTALVFDADEANTENLGVILESSQLQSALWSQLSGSGVHLLSETKVRHLKYYPDRVELQLESDLSISAKLLIAADGGNSFVRQQSAIGVQEHTYEQVGVVANFETELPHQGIARQWFRDDGILAWLPMPGNRISMVWSTPLSKELMILSAEALAERVAEAGVNTLGKLQTISPAAIFSLQKQTADNLIKPRLALVGDAAHRVHPLAGQGVNLGFRDVVELEKVLSQSLNSYQDIGDFYLLRQYERARKLDMLGMGFVTHGLQTLFKSDKQSIKELRNWGMRQVNKSGFIKKQLTKHAII